MNVSEFLYKHLSPVGKTTPAPAPLETNTPFITYSIDGQENTSTLKGSGYAQNFVSVTVYESEYDKADTLAQLAKEALLCVKDDGIIGVTFTSKSHGYDAEPVARYYVTLEFNIYEG